MANTIEAPRSEELATLIAVVAAPPAGPDTLAPVAQDDAPVSATEGRPTVPELTSACMRAAAPAHGDDVMDMAFFASGGAAEEMMREEARRLAELERAERPLPPSKQQIARRRSFQRVVAIVVASAAAMFFGAVGISAARGKPTASADVTAAVRPITLAEPARNPVPAEPTKVEQPAVAAPALVTSKEEAPAAKDDAPAAKEDAPAAKAAPERDPEAAKALTKKALSALERGKFADAIAHGSAAVDADPTDANAYLYWGTALMETGKRADAKTVFAACVESATRGPKHECRAFR